MIVYRGKKQQLYALSIDNRQVSDDAVDKQGQNLNSNGKFQFLDALTIRF